MGVILVGRVGFGRGIMWSQRGPGRWGRAMRYVVIDVLYKHHIPFRVWKCMNDDRINLDNTNLV